MDYIAETKKPNFWIQDYANAWLGPSHALHWLERNEGDTEENIREVRAGVVPTFEEFVSMPERVYSGVRCDRSIIPKRFTHQNDRLVRMYNQLLEEDEINVPKLRRIIDLALDRTSIGWN